MIRGAVGDDLDSITELWAAFMREAPYVDFNADESAKSEWKEYAAKHLEEQGFGILVNDEEGINAFLMYEPRKAVFKSNVRKGYISDLYVKPESRRSGIGRSLLAEAVTAMKKQYDRIQLQVDSDNLNAIALYRSAGFRDFSFILDYQ